MQKKKKNFVTRLFLLVSSSFLFLLLLFPFPHLILALFLSSYVLFPCQANMAHESVVCVLLTREFAASYSDPEIGYSVSDSLSPQANIAMLFKSGCDLCLPHFLPFTTLSFEGQGQLSQYSDYGVDCRGIGFRFTVGTKVIFVSHSVQTGSGTHPASYLKRMGAVTPGVK
jgi:hypothetical protein